ncbi:MAG: hypothetical protein ACQESF_07120, partial [Nanobdellota archaeon]
MDTKYSTLDNYLKRSEDVQVNKSDCVLEGPEAFMEIYKWGLEEIKENPCFSSYDTIRSELKRNCPAGLEEFLDSSLNMLAGYVGKEVENAQLRASNSKLQEEKYVAEEKASLDSLTGLYNQNTFYPR